MRFLRMLRQAAVPIMLVACIAIALFQGVGLLLLAGLATGALYGFVLAKDRTLFMLLLVFGGSFSFRGKMPASESMPDPFPVNPDWLDIGAGLVIIIAVLVAAVVMLVSGFVLGMTLGESRSRPSQQ